MTKNNNQLTQQILQRLSVLETTVNDIVNNHLKSLQNSQTKIMWLLITTLTTALIALGLQLSK